jgi:putative transposase
LLKFAGDRRRWLYWLYQARKRYGLTILNYMVTSNHIHSLVADDGDREVIPKSIKLIAGRMGQEYNQRKSRKGAFWEDRYHGSRLPGMAK